jgi:AraC-like DNA-binding protein
MDNTLAQLEQCLSDHLACNQDQQPLGGIGLFHCVSPQALRQMPILQPTLILVVRGQKRVQVAGREFRAEAGELIIAPVESVVEVGNRPTGKPAKYLSLAIGFAPEAMAQFRRDYGAELGCWEDAPRWQAPAPEELLSAMYQWVQWCQQHTPDPLVVRHRQVEFLLTLARAGAAGNLLAGHEDTRQQIVALLSLDPARDWSVGDVCRRLGTSESSLRRRLREAGTGFREILESVRLVAGLSLLQETFWPIGQVACAVGYQSQSRFAERFKARFGLTPSELRQTRVTVSGEIPNVSGKAAG